MEYDEHEGQEEEEEAAAASVRQSYGLPVGDGARRPTRYRECLKNHALSVGGHAVDGCGEFMAAGEEGTLDALRCAACNCHRNFHRKETDNCRSHQQVSSYYRSPPYLHLNPHHRPVGTYSSQEEEEEEDASNPSSSGGRKRFRTKFTAEQKKKMLQFAEEIGWRIRREEAAAVERFCEEAGVSRHVLKVWMHNNKNTTTRCEQVLFRLRTILADQRRTSSPFPIAGLNEDGGRIERTRKWFLELRPKHALRMSRSSVRSCGRMTSVEEGRYVNRKCWCGRRAEVRISESEKNPGKLYYKCAEKKCEFWDWCVANGEKELVECGRTQIVKNNNFETEVCRRLERMELAFARARDVFFIFGLLNVFLVVVICCLVHKLMNVM